MVRHGSFLWYLSADPVASSLTEEAMPKKYHVALDDELWQALEARRAGPLTLRRRNRVEVLLRCDAGIPTPKSPSPSASAPTPSPTSAGGMSARTVAIGDIHGC